MSKQYMVIVDYNLSRFPDIQMMSRYAKDKYGLSSILIRSNPRDVDYEVADIVIDLDPLASNFVSKALTELDRVRSQIQLVLPFSDNAVVTGAQLAEALNKKGDSSILARAAFSKIEYRLWESDLKQYAESQKTFVPKFSKIYTKKELLDFSAKCPNGFVLKPSCEGNNRGVIKLKPHDDLDSAFLEVEKYLSQGLICEELIYFPEEYSFDGIGQHLSFITEKDSVDTRYPVERGQIVPARVSSSSRKTIEQAGKFANFIVGQYSGPFHNEIKFDPGKNTAAVIEPNRRPAGMKIWHLAEKVFGLNFFHLWIDAMLGKRLPETLPQPKGIAAIRVLTAPKNGKLTHDVTTKESQAQILSNIMSKLTKSNELKEDQQWFDFKIITTVNSPIRKEPRDNSEFIAEVCLFISDHTADIKKTLEAFERSFHQEIEQYIA